MKFPRKLSRKIIVCLVAAFIFLFCLFIIVGLQFLAVRNITDATNKLSSTPPTYESLSLWVTSVSNSLQYLGNEIDPSLPFQAIRSYTEFFPKFNSSYLFDLPEIQVVNEGVVTSEVDYPIAKETDPNFPENLSYIYNPGQPGTQQTYTFQLKFADSASKFESIQQEIAPQPEIMRVGSASPDKVEALAKDAFSMVNLTSTVFHSITLASVVEQNENVVTVGLLHGTKHRCAQNLSTALTYDIESQKYITPDVVSLSIACLTGSRILLTCTDCTLAPVDKIYTLPSDYIPEVVPTELPGEKELTPAAKTALTKMFTDANNKGVYPFIVSGYRSYQAQVATFEYWVQQEMAKGLSRTQAEVIANTYSALPGQSEHQLGTAVDLSCTDCDPFTNINENQVIYDYLKTNAHLFGFVISYPANKDTLTGYKYEPWHIRYIGVDLATDIYNQGYQNIPGTYLGLYLFMLNQY